MSNVSFHLRPMGGAEPQSCFMLRVVLLTGVGSAAGSAAVGVKPKENVPAAADVNMRIMWPACGVSQTPTSCCLTITLLLPLNDISKRICFTLFSDRRLLLSSRKEIYVWVVEVFQMWVRFVSSTRL